MEFRQKKDPNLQIMRQKFYNLIDAAKRILEKSFYSCEIMTKPNDIEELGLTI